MARWKIPFDAVDPKDVGGIWRTGVSEAHFSKLQHNGHDKALARLILVREVLLEGLDHIYGGWSRPDMGECFVYVGRPSRDFKSFSIETPPPNGMVFVVFVLPDGTIDDWTWRFSADGERPDGVSGDLLWPLPNQT